MRAILSLILALLAFPAVAQPYPTNTCPAELQMLDAFGQAQCFHYIDPDNSLVLAPADDPKLIPYAKAPWDFQRMKVEDGFTLPSLSPVWASQVTGSGSIASASPARLCIRTGTGPAGSGALIKLANVYTAIGWDARAYFFLEVPTSGNFDLQFGFMSPATYERAMLRRFEYATPQPWEAFTQNAAGQPIGTYSPYGADNLRRIGIIWMRGDHIEYYAANQLNRFDTAAPFASHASNLPGVNSPLVPFVSFQSALAGSDRTVCLSKFAFSGSE